MKTSAERDRVVGAVHTIRAKYRWFESVPEADPMADGAIVVKLTSSDDVGYVEALYEICAKGALIGRGVVDGVPVLIGTKE